MFHLFAGLLVLVVTASCSSIKQTVPKCNPTRHGETLTYISRMNNRAIVICVREGSNYRWKFRDGSSTYGEIYNPATDCSDVVDKLENVQNGFYWISINKTHKQKVWCDVNVDGGGFMLIGMNDNPKSWTVPSSASPVDPQGPPHWSSVLGDSEIQDFAVQFSTDVAFENTKAHWIYHLNAKRKLGKLFSNDPATGCTSLHPGIGDMMYVKDALTGSIATTKFRCSKFGSHTNPLLGWGKMNFCLRQNCPNGYASFPGVSFIYDQFGSYSYSAESPSSGMGERSTAFVGCDHGKCCACHGPQGGRKNYCAPKCTALNGGTVMKQAFVWYWARTRLPAKRLWRRCMEFLVKNAQGKFEKHFIDPRTDTVHKGSCSYHFMTLLNEGTLTVKDKESLKKIPNVPGLLSYREDSKHVYVNQGSRWQELSNKDEVQQLKEKQTKEIEKLKKQLENKYEDVLRRIRKLDPKPATSCTAWQNKDRANLAKSGYYQIKPQGLNASVPVYCDMVSKNRTGVTVIGHDSESRTYVRGYEKPGTYKRHIKYDIAMDQIVAIIKQSSKCEQFIKYECHGSVLLYSSPFGWWVSREGKKLNYWGGAAVDSGKCACGMTNSCAGGNKCNCDKNDNAWREDSGFLTDKNTLPVSDLRFGDTGDTSEKGYHTLGKLRCWG